MTRGITTASCGIGIALLIVAGLAGAARSPLGSSPLPPPTPSVPPTIFRGGDAPTPEGYRTVGPLGAPVTATATATPVATATPLPTATPAPLPTIPSARAQGGGWGNVITSYLGAMHAAEAAYGLPRGMIAAIYFHESGGWPYNCPGYNCTGIGINSPGGLWAFGSYEEGIDATARLLSQPPYPGDTMGKLCMWQNGGATNPCSYGERVIAKMAEYQ